MSPTKHVCPGIFLVALLVSTGCETEAGLWERTQQDHTVEAYESFRSMYPNSVHDEVAESTIVAMDWAEAETTNTVDGFEAFLTKHPDRNYADTARERIDHLEKTALHRAARAGDVQNVASLVGEGADINATEFTGATPLHIASGGCHEDVVDLLIERGAEVNHRAEDDATPLHWAARGGCIPAMQALIDAGAELDIAVRQSLSGYAIGSGTATYFSGREPAIKGSPLHWAIEFEQPGAASFLVERGADVNMTTGWGLSPLHRAADSGSAQVVELLLRHGAKVYDGELRNGQPIHYAKNRRVSELLVEHGAKTNVNSRFKGKPIHNAAYLGHADAVKHFVESGVSIDERGSWNMDSGHTDEVTPMWTAAYGGELDIVRSLERDGGDLTFSAKSIGGSLLHAAAWRGHAEVIEYLLSKGLAVDTRATMPTIFPLNRPWSSATPLSVAAHFGHVDAIGTLLRGGADINAITDEKWTPIRLAMVAQQKEAVQYLLDHGAALDLTAEELDRWNTSDDIKAMLREHFAVQDVR